MPRRVLITGVTGFAGSHLAERFVAAAVETHGLAVEDPPYPFLAQALPDVRVHRGDVTSVEDVAASLEAADPDVVVHLAGQAVPALASADPRAAVRVNVLGTAAVLQAVEAHDPHRPRLVIASSADVYGAPETSPVDERAPVRPANVYAATKVAAEALARDVGDRAHRSVVILRPTNQIGPRQHPGLAASAFAKQIAEAESGLAEPLVRHGDLRAERDFLDVRDMADAYARAAEIEEPGTHVFNVGTGRAVSIATVLEILMELSRVPMRDELDPSLVRGSPSVLALDATAFRTRTGWEPRTALRTSLADTLDHWRSRVGREVRA